MPEYQLLELARESGEFDSDEDADETIRATLDALSNCASRGELRDVAEPLPETYASILREPGPSQPTPLDLDEFVDSVRAETGEQAVESRIRAVLAALTELVGEDEIADLRAQLPPAYGQLFESATVDPDETFVDVVTTESDLNADAAERAARETLGLLGHRLSEGEATDISTYLRGDAADWLRRTATHEAEAIPAEEFVDRIARDAEVSEARAREYVGAVSDALVEVVPEQERENAMAQLPAQYGSVLDLEGYSND